VFRIENLTFLLWLFSLYVIDKVVEHVVTSHVQEGSLEIQGSYLLTILIQHLNDFTVLVFQHFERFQSFEECATKLVRLLQS